MLRDFIIEDEYTACEGFFKKCVLRMRFLAVYAMSVCALIFVSRELEVVHAAGRRKEKRKKTH